MNFVVPKLEVLDLSNTNVDDDETLYVISKNCSGILELRLINCDWVIEKGVKDVVENCKQQRQIVLRGSHISDEIRELAMDASFSSVLKLI
ncbi:RNI superfamily protein, putative [Medicago truncatula]|uniref:RNI superfamily protein, putative n=1 Tax=Medicago truncatula TaxID=3880 RepID=A0A072TDS9_MEDTR|nr:RNI superfamily protein, putative [Medicago truncatula]